MKMQQTLHVQRRDEWHKWLSVHAAGDKEVWLIFNKRRTQQPSITYEDAAEEALCFGWIDSIIQRIDEDTYARKFTPRTNKRKWSPSNIARMRKLLHENRVAPAGLAVFDLTLLEQEPPVPNRHVEAPQALLDALRKNAAANAYYQSLPPSHRRQYHLWILSARKEETRQRRILRAVAMLEAKRKPGTL